MMTQTTKFTTVITIVMSGLAILISAFSLFLDFKQQNTIKRTLDASVAIEKRPIIDLTIEEDSSSFTLGYSITGIKKPADTSVKGSIDSSTINTSLTAKTSVKVRCFNRSSEYIAKIKQCLVGYSGDQTDMLRDILLKRYTKPANRGDISIETGSIFKLTQLQPETEWNFRFLIDNVPIVSTGHLVLHVIFIYENEYGVIYDTYKKVQIGLNLETIVNNTMRMLKGSQTGSGYLLNNQINWDESPYTVYTYTPEERRILSESLSNLDVLLSNYSK